jgi:hypothetical protein
MTELALQERPKRGRASDQRTPARDRKAWQALISEARNGRLMALGRDNFHDGGEEQIFGAK